MVSKDAVRNIIGIIGNVVSFFLFASPAPTFYTIIQRRDVEEFSPNPYLATVLNCSMWVFYGMPFVHPNSVLVVTINGIGLLIEFVYIAIYLRFANKKQRLYVLYVLAGEAVFFALVASLTLSLVHTHAKRSLVTGIVCVFFNICMYGMPLDIMRKVIKTKSVEYLPFYLSLANFLNSFIWLAYGQLRFDLFLTISNGAGVLLGGIQLILYMTYYKTTPKKDNKKSTTAGAQLSSTTADGRIRPSV